MVTSESLADIEVESHSQVVNWCFKLAFFFLKTITFRTQVFFCRKTQSWQLYAMLVEPPRGVAYLIHASFWYFSVLTDLQNTGKAFDTFVD